MSELDNALLSQAIQIGIEDGFKSTKGEQPTLRDQFAMAALSGEIARSAGFYPKPENVAPYCYELADAMLNAREVKEVNDEQTD